MMKFLILLVLCFQMFSCAIIPKIVTGKAEFHRCLVSYVTSHGITTELASEDSLDENVNCTSLHDSIETMMETIYENMKNTLPSGLNDTSETDCVMNIFTSFKFFEINIVLAAAHMTTPVPAENPLHEVQAMTKSIFAIAAMKCFWNDENLVEIIEDFSRKVNVSDKEFDCILLDLTEKKLLNEEIVEETTELMTTEFTTVEIDTEVPNAIMKSTPEEASAEADKSCTSLLQGVSEKITLYEFADLTHEQNRCMSNHVTPSNVTAVYEVIVLGKLGKTLDDQTRRRELIKNLIFGCIWNLVGCTDIFGFNEFVIDNLLPQLENE